MCGKKAETAAVMKCVFCLLLLIRISSTLVAIAFFSSQAVRKSVEEWGMTAILFCQGGVSRGALLYSDMFVFLFLNLLIKKSQFQAILLKTGKLCFFSKWRQQKS